MEDSILYEKIYSAILKLSKEGGLDRVNKVKILVNKNNNICKRDLCKYLEFRNNILFGEWTYIDIEEEEIEIITAIIKIVA